MRREVEAGEGDEYRESRKEIQRYFKIPKVNIKKKNKRELGRIYAPYLTPSTKIK